MQPGDEITIEPSELVAGGAALAKLEGFPVFAMNVFPGDRARVRLFEVKKGFARADLVELLEPSPLRRAHPARSPATAAGATGLPCASTPSSKRSSGSSPSRCAASGSSTQRPFQRSRCTHRR